MTSQSNLTAAFIDLATYDVLEQYLYGGTEAIAYFVRQTRKSTWFSHIPVCLSQSGGTPGFGKSFTATISRAGDYCLNSWIRIVIPKVSTVVPPAVASGATADATNLRSLIRWTRNLTHNLVKDIQLTFNDLEAEHLTSVNLDFWAAFTVPASKRAAYDKMIGNRPELIQPAHELPETILYLPIPFFFSRDSGIALPTAALPYNEMKINITLEQRDNLLVQYNPATATTWKAVGENSSMTTVEQSADIKADIWATYAIVSNDERKRMACAPRDILIEQFQNSYPVSVDNSSSGIQNSDIRYSHAVKSLFFLIKNKTVKGEQSNYLMNQPVLVNENTAAARPIKVYFDEDDCRADSCLVGASGAERPLSLKGVDGNMYSGTPLKSLSLIYENTGRLVRLDSSYYSLINPYYFAPTVPAKEGYCMYSYTLDIGNLDPMGSTNHGKLTNVTLSFETKSHLSNVTSTSDGQVTLACGYGHACAQKQKFDFVNCCINNNIIRISGGALGFPVL